MEQVKSDEKAFLPRWKAFLKYNSMEQVKSDEKAFLPKVILNGLFDKTRCEN